MVPPPLPALDAPPELFDDEEEPPPLFFRLGLLLPESFLSPPFLYLRTTQNPGGTNLLKQ